MAKVDILATWQSCKTLIQQAKEYANSGYSTTRKKGSAKISDILNIGKISGNKENEAEEDLVPTPAQVPPEILSALETEFRKIIEFIEIFLMQDQAAAFYGLILIETESEICFTQQGVIDVDVKSKPFKIKYNPLWAEDYSINELIGATINEIIKIVYLHPTTFAKLNRDKDKKKHYDLESGSSVSSSELVLRDITFAKTKNRVKLHDSVYRISDLEEELDTNRPINRGDSLEYYYKVAEALRKKDPNQNGQGQGQGSGDSSMSMPGEGPMQNGISTPENGNNGKATHSWEDTQNPDDLEDDIKQVIKNAFDNLSDEQRGRLPGNMVSHIEMLFKKPELNWKDILRRYVGNIPSGHRPSRMRLNRRQPYRFDLAGTLSNKVVKLVIAIDTSGSMSDRDIAYCMNEIYNIVKDYKTDITVIECDMSIGRIYKVKSPKDINPKVTGRGGTEFSPVIEYINNHKFRDAVMIYFTDGWGESRIERPRTYRNLWIIRGKEPYISVENPYGEVKCLSGDQDYTSLYN